MRVIKVYNYTHYKVDRVQKGYTNIFDNINEYK